MPSATCAEPVSTVEESSEVGSLEHLKSTDAFPKLKAQRVHTDGEVCSSSSVSLDAPSAPDPPFPLLPGEYVNRFGQVSSSIQLYLTNFRLFILLDQQKFYNIPLPCVDGVEARDTCYLLVTCKDGRIVKIVADNSDNCLLWYKLLTTLATGASKREDVFAFAFYAWCTDEQRQLQVGLRLLDAYHPTNLDPNEVGQARAAVLAEFRRLEFSTSVWRISARNENYKLCDSYPRFLIVPVGMRDEELDRCAQHRFLNRLPAIVWRHRKRGSVLLRSSQPTAGILGWRCPEDELYLQALLTASARHPDLSHPHQHTDQVTLNGAQPVAEPQASLVNTKSMLILDARSYAAAWANRAKGGGFESEEYYQKCEVQFKGLANIHTIRSSFQQLRSLLCSDAIEQQNTWLQSLQNTQWLYHLSSLFGAAVAAVEALNNCGRSVLVHCSDGWDRTAQIISLAKLILDPFYRTMRGFRELVEREWIEFGHKFADRCGILNKNVGEKSPVFVQWLDCVHQLHHQFPGAFEFNQAYLVKLAQHAYSGLFGTFLCNSTREAACQLVNQRTFSVWAYLHPDNVHFRNVIYEWEEGVLWPDYQQKDLRLWKQLYCSGQPAGAPRLRSSSVQSSGGTMERSLTRAHSCDSLTSGAASDSNPTLVRTGSDGNLNSATTAPPCSPAIQFSLGQEEKEVCRVLDRVLSRVSESQSDCDEPLTPRPLAHSRDVYETDNNNYSMEEDDELRGEFSLCADPVCANGTGGRQTGCGCAGWSVGTAESNSDVSTSTTDISDSLVRRNLLLTSSVQFVHRTKMQNGFNKASGVTLLANPIGDAERRWFGWEKEMRRPLRSKWKRRRKVVDWLDSDGLTTLLDVQQERMRHLHNNYIKLYERMDCEMQRMRIQLLQQQNGFTLHNCTNGIKVPGTDDGVGEGFEPRSVDSGGQSDVSWEAIEEGEGQPTKWIPDHAVSHCMSCDAEFWTINRRHHCRNCGKVFCSQCSKFECPVPEEQLYEPVRVCNTCYHILRSKTIQTSAQGVV